MFPSPWKLNNLAWPARCSNTCHLEQVHHSPQNNHPIQEEHSRSETTRVPNVAVLISKSSATDPVTMNLSFTLSPLGVITLGTEMAPRPTSSTSISTVSVRMQPAASTAQYQYVPPATSITSLVALCSKELYQYHLKAEYGRIDRSRSFRPAMALAR